MTSTPCMMAPRRWPFPTADAAATQPAAPSAEAPAPAPMTGRPADDAGTCTGWFPGTLQPVQPGVYQRRNSLGHVLYSLWDGDIWHWNHPSPWAAERDAEPSLAQQLEWRGLRVPPAEGYGPATSAPEAQPC